MLAYPVRIDKFPTLLGGTLGAASAAVKDLQTALKSKGYDPGPIDGFLGKLTLTALSQVVGRLSGIPSVVKTVLQYAPTAIAFLPASTIQSIVSTITPYVAVITAAVRLLASNNTGASGGAGGYPAGSIQRYHVSRKVWRIYAPVGVSGLDGLGADNTGKLPTTAPVGMTLVAETAAKADGVPDGGLEDDPIYKKPWAWAAAAGGAAVVGSGLYLVFRK